MWQVRLPSSYIWFRSRVTYELGVVGRAPRPYDLMWPLARRREGAMLVGSVDEGKDTGLGLGEPEKGLCEYYPTPLLPKA